MWQPMHVCSHNRKFRRWRRTKEWSRCRFTCIRLSSITAVSYTLSSRCVFPGTSQTVLKISTTSSLLCTLYIHVVIFSGPVWFIEPEDNFELNSLGWQILLTSSKLSVEFSYVVLSTVYQNTLNFIFHCVTWPRFLLTKINPRKALSCFNPPHWVDRTWWWISCSTPGSQKIISVRLLLWVGLISVEEFKKYWLNDYG